MGTDGNYPMDLKFFGEDVAAFVVDSMRHQLKGKYRQGLRVDRGRMEISKHFRQTDHALGGLRCGADLGNQFSRLQGFRHQYHGRVSFGVAPAAHSELPVS